MANILLLIQQYPDCDSRQWLDIVQSAELNLQQIFGPGSLLMDFDNTRQHLDGYLDLIPRLREAVGLDTLAPFFIYIGGGEFVQNLQLVIHLPGMYGF
jgi:hypothetical protein